MAHPTTIYHIAVRSDWEAQSQAKGHYFAPTYEQVTQVTTALQQACN